MLVSNFKRILSVCVIIAISIVASLFYYTNKLQSNEESYKEKISTTADSEQILNTKTIQKSTTTNLISPTNTIDTTHITLGDGKLSTSPKRGYVYSCENNFPSNAYGASKDGDWINGDTWNLKEKISVSGENSWSAAWFEKSLTGVIRSLIGNGLPVGSKTGTFPIAKDDPAYDVDRNPNTIKEQAINIKLTNAPQIASKASCLPMGAIGRAINGVAIYNALDGKGEDAVAHEVQDICNGHPEHNGEYHYHGPSNCIAGLEQANTLIGYALDGFGIYSKYDINGKEYTNQDLDECHGVTSEILWDGSKVNMYHYVMTQEYPYTLGCFRGTTISSKNNSKGTLDTSSSNPPLQQNNTQTNNIPKEAIEACNNKNKNSICTINTPNGALSGTCKIPPSQNILSCIPDNM